MYENGEIQEKAILAGVHCGLADSLKDTTEESMRELELLAATAGAEVVGTLIQNREAPDKATYVGEGKLAEIAAACETLGANLVIFDDELTGSQLKNIEKALDGIRVIDRSALILDIFAQRALSGEGKLQVELAQYKYNLPRLGGGYTSLSRLGGGIGTRGPGETKLETDRRYIRGRINALESEIRAIARHRELIRERRRKNETPVAALVGYTNAGKSTILNALTEAGVLAEDMLFATLDPTARRITMPDGRESVLIDTVGFIRKLPHHLIEAFKSTLEEAVTADVLLHIIDSSSEEMENQTAVVDDLLRSLGCEQKPVIRVYNKIDLNKNFLPKPPYTQKSVFISAKSGEGIDTLIKELDYSLPGRRTKMRVLVPYTDGGATNDIRLLDSLISEEYTPDGVMLEFMADEKARSAFEKYEV
ncbi:MAG: GTPase HflX [Clostridia bacterium]|nr:GTPase HflX [Clostridia bacterium]